MLLRKNPCKEEREGKLDVSVSAFSRLIHGGHGSDMNHHISVGGEVYGVCLCMGKRERTGWREREEEQRKELETS